MTLTFPNYLIDPERGGDHQKALRSAAGMVPFYYQRRRVWVRKPVDD